MLRNLLLIPALLLFMPVYGQKAKKSAHARNASASTTDYSKTGSPLPPIKVLTTDGRTLTEKDLSFSGNLFLMLFNPTCEHCEDATEVLKKNIGLFKTSRILMVCPGTMKENLSDFEKIHTTYRYPAITTGLDDMNIINNAFLYKSLPQINIYDTNRKLIKIFTGDMVIDSLKPYIQ